MRYCRGTSNKLEWFDNEDVFSFWLRIGGLAIHLCRICEEWECSWIEK
jgi:hypothetical protein